MQQEIQYLEKPLSIHDKFKLVVIAHETSNHDLQIAALRVLDQAINPLVIVSNLNPKTIK